ncbi:uncharacterized protein LOC120565391 isoform X3 [Lates japonicus]
MLYTCYNTSDPRAVNATKLYDDRNGSGHFWMRDPQTPLPLCSNHSPNSTCWVCTFQKTIYAVCRQLEDGVEMVMEGDGVGIDIQRSRCPDLPSDGQPSSIIIAIIIAAILILIIGVVWCRCFRRNRQQTGPEQGPEPSTQIPMLENGVRTAPRDPTNTGSVTSGFH